MASLTAYLSGLAGDAFGALDLPRDLGLVSRSDRPDLGQFQCNGAMAAARIAKTNPRKIADQIVAALSENGCFSDVSIAGPGFINLSVTDEFLGRFLTSLAADDRLGVEAAPQKVLFDYGGPNIAKPMHVGHLRSTIIGDSLTRLFRFVGAETLSDVHMGDWGKPMGMLISALEAEQPDLPYFDASRSGSYPEESPVTLEDLERLYPVAAAACKADPVRDEAARLATVDLQSGRPGYRALWGHFLAVSRRAMEREFGALGVAFDLWKGESDVHDLIPGMIASLKKAGLARKDQGALIIDVAEPDDSHEIPPLILEKSDGGATYATTDLATILDRVETGAPDAIFYVVDQRQHMHFEQVFRAAKKGGLSGRAALEHIGFGTMNGADGKPFKTRAGGVMKLHDLIAMVREKASERLSQAGLATDFSQEERALIANQVGIGALKFADLNTHRLSDYIFDLDRFMRFEGKTGPYLQYAAVRIKSILRKAVEEDADIPDAALSITSDVERALGLALSAFPEAMEAALERRAPNLICDHVYALAQAYSRFYAEHHILSEKDEALRGSRLGLCRAALTQLVAALGLLGIDVPKRM